MKFKKIFAGVNSGVVFEKVDLKTNLEIQISHIDRLIEKKDAIVDAESGVTRDRNYGKCDWNGKEFSIIDTGGYLVGGDDIFEKQIDKQVELAIDECDLIIFLVDVESGLIGMDQEAVSYTHLTLPTKRIV